MSDVVNGRERIVGFLREFANSSAVSVFAKAAVIKWAFVNLTISEDEYKELTAIYMSTFKAKHQQGPKRKRRKMPVKKHVLTRQKFAKVKEMLTAERPLSNRSIAEIVGVSERTILRARKGEYDSYFKPTAKRNADAVA